MRGGSLWAVQFDEDRLAIVGNAVPVVEGIRVEGGGAVQYAIAGDGWLVYVPAGRYERAHPGVGRPRRPRRAHRGRAARRANQKDLSLLKLLLQDRVD